jgi:hypothetical protein
MCAKSWMFFLICALNLAPAGFMGAANGADAEPTITLTFAAKTDGHPSLFVYAKGMIAGIAPGTVAFPQELEGVAIEIGLPQLRRLPLYSFVLGPVELKMQSTDVITSNFYFNPPDFSSPRPSDVWSALFIKPTAKAAVKIAINTDGDYAMELPPEPYDNIRAFLTAYKIDPKTSEWFGDIPPQNDGSGGAVAHVTFDKAQNKTVNLAGQWSGAHTALLQMPIPKESWIIRSDPTAATIHTDEGLQGVTDTLIRVAVTGGRYIILRKDGYIDSPQTSCQQSITSGVKDLFCKLKKKK